MHRPERLDRHPFATSVSPYASQSQTEAGEWTQEPPRVDSPAPTPSAPPRRLTKRRGGPDLPPSLLAASARSSPAPVLRPPLPTRAMTAPPASAAIAPPAPAPRPVPVPTEDSKSMRVHRQGWATPPLVRSRSDSNSSATPSSSSGSSGASTPTLSPTAGVWRGPVQANFEVMATLHHQPTVVTKRPVMRGEVYSMDFSCRGDEGVAASTAGVAKGVARSGTRGKARSRKAKGDTEPDAIAQGLKAVGLW